ncbi:MAG: hypothetical protein Q4A54_13555 [Parabacteroides sp.]|nr:hypothetical protein [Parabacteroides sp.]
MDEAVICPGCGCMVNGKTTTPSKNQSQKKTSVSLILGIIGIVFAWLFALVGHIVSIIGIVFGIKEYKESEKMTGVLFSRQSLVRLLSLVFFKRENNFSVL